jgi:hypothetical protein
MKNAALTIHCARQIARQKATTQDLSTFAIEQPGFRAALGSPNPGGLLENHSAT